MTKAPATGDASIVAAASTPLRTRRPLRAAAQAATPAAIPSRNGIRPIATLESTPAVNSQAATAPCAGKGAAERASCVNRATAAIAARTPTFAGPIAAAGGANSRE
jgi:hypothetical protein